MRISVSADMHGRRANPAAVRATAVAAEQVGYAGVWIGNGTPRLDPVAVLGAVAEVTTHIPLGLVLTGPWPPVSALARSVATLDALCGARLQVALGLPDHCAGPSDAGPDALAELCRALDTGRRPDVLVTDASEAALGAVAAVAAGWCPAGLDPAQLAAGWAAIRAGADARGRDVSELRLVVRVVAELRSRELGEVARQLDDLRAVGVHEVVLGFAGEVGFDEALDGFAQLAEAVV